MCHAPRFLLSFFKSFLELLQFVVPYYVQTGKTSIDSWKNKQKPSPKYCNTCITDCAKSHYCSTTIPTSSMRWNSEAELKTPCLHSTWQIYPVCIVMKGRNVHFAFLQDTLLFGIECSRLQSWWGQQLLFTSTSPLPGEFWLDSELEFNWSMSGYVDRVGRFVAISES